jgi:hypothetical protein
VRVTPTAASDVKRAVRVHVLVYEARLRTVGGADQRISMRT